MWLLPVPFTFTIACVQPPPHLTKNFPSTTKEIGDVCMQATFTMQPFLHTDFLNNINKKKSVGGGVGRGQYHQYILTSTVSCLQWLPSKLETCPVHMKVLVSLLCFQYNSEVTVQHPQGLYSLKSLSHGHLQNDSINCL